ncbi:protein kinase [Telmatocola sphagniphila]|uniref:non-specific serine/threonine protein kinase n=1 Tax=Telmatocola sphagniphila TaxID=1123043 RepID=A0A8E6B6V3_9BACT|nr:protein kinase [Telmatocola sphagniphila]QVL32982.1 protein kinase [Telmatocola sphagniphila]
MQKTVTGSGGATLNFENEIKPMQRPVDPYEKAPPLEFRARDYLHDLLDENIVMADDWKNLPSHDQEAVFSSRTVDALLRNMMRFGLINKFQSERLRSGRRFGLVINSYRILGHLGSGGMGVIYVGEHIRMRYRVAIKTLNWSRKIDEQMVSRFYAEVRAVGELQHPNIVSALDAGSIPNPDPEMPELHYFVMEYLAGQDLDSLVRKKGPLSVDQACKMAHQVADALAEAHRNNLVHRDIKPSNILLTFAGVAKVLDFGLARNLGERMTLPGTILGTVGYMSPEQAQDASSVDGRSDLYGLGATLYWCLTGKDPFPVGEEPAQDLIHRLTQPPPSIRKINPSLPQELDELIQKMMQVHPEDRLGDAKEVMKLLMPFQHACVDQLLPEKKIGKKPKTMDQGGAQQRRVLVVDDDKNIRSFSKMILQGDGCICDEAEDGAQALEKLTLTPYDLVLLDINMPNMNGTAALRQIRQTCTIPNLKIMMFSGDSQVDDLAKLLVDGADDFLHKPFSVIQFRSRVKTALRHKEAQDRADFLNRQLLNANAKLEQNLLEQNSDLVLMRNTLILTLADLVEGKCAGTKNHLRRIQAYARVLGEKAMASPHFSGQIDEAFLQALEACSPLHDIGNAALPDHILLKPGKLVQDELIQMQAHTVIGADTLKKIAHYECFSQGFLQMAVDIARHHHERFDGSGYPDGLSGMAIPLSARIVAIADVYDALRCAKTYKPAIQHNTAVKSMVDCSPGQFDPNLLDIFHDCSSEFEKIFKSLSE